MTVVLISLLALLGIGDEEPFAWPLSRDRQLTSSFGEYRPGRLHAGIDLRTGGIGLPVYAAADGAVSRIRCSPWGYGKAVYLTTTDGHTIVYAHLDDYAPALRTYVQQAQHKAQSYTVDLYPPPAQFPVKRGELIAKSGQTGIGAPHLHYEIRNAQQQPVNPVALGVHWPDTTPPHFRSLLISPGDSHTVVNGDMIPVTLDIQQSDAHHYTCAPVRIKGTAGFGVDLIDAGSNGNKLGVYSLRLLKNDQEFFSVRHDVLSYATLHHGRVAYHPYYIEENRFLLLWRWPGNLAQSYTHSSGNGWLSLPDQETSITIEATDFAGNTALLTVPIVSENTTPAQAPAPEQILSGHGTVSYTCLEEDLLVTARFSMPEPQTPVLSIRDAQAEVAKPMNRINDTTFRVRIMAPATGQYAFRVQHPRAESVEQVFTAFKAGSPEAHIEQEGLLIEVQPDSAYGTLWVQVRQKENPGPAKIRRLGPAWTVWPDTMPIDHPVTLRFPVPDGIIESARVQVYKKTNSGWSSLDTRQEGDHLVIKTRTFGVFAVMEDHLAPTITVQTPPDGYTAQTRRPKFRARIDDIGSGVDQFSLHCEDQWLLAAYDPEHKMLFWERDEDLPSGTHRFRFTVTDEVGNQTRIQRTVTIP